MTVSRNCLLYQAELACESDRFDDMLHAMKQVAQKAQELTVSERNLLSKALRECIAERRASRGVLDEIETDESKEEESAERSKRLKVVQDYQLVVESEILAICHEILDLIADNLLPNSSFEDAKVFYLTLQGDCHRYISECEVGVGADENGGTSLANALASYNEALGTAEETMGPAHPQRLASVKKLCMFHEDYLGDEAKATAVAQKAIQDVMTVLQDANNNNNSTIQPPPKKTERYLQRLNEFVTTYKSTEMEESLH